MEFLPPTVPSTTFTLPREENFPSSFRASDSCPPSVETNNTRTPDRLRTYYDSLRKVPSIMAFCPFPNLQPKDSILEQYKQSLEEKVMAVKSLLHIQQLCEEREVLLRFYLSQEDIERLASEREPVRDAATVGAKYFHAVWVHNLKSFGDNLSLCLA